ncbi:UNVERIFIED_CONTAM: hypothetical protein FKN15_073121 [Acipenser sinensis]
MVSMRTRKEMLENEVNRLQFQRIYVQGYPATRPGPADSSACLDRTPTRVGCACRHCIGTGLDSCE